MAYPTTLALITALWSGPARTKSIALWSALGGAISALGPLLSGLLLEHFWWGSVFLLTLPLAVVALVLAMRLVPAHVNETTDPVDNLGGILSVAARRGARPGDQLRAGPERGHARRSGSSAIARRGGRRVRHPAAPGARTRCTTSTSPVGGSSGSRRAPGIIVFGSLMGAMFVGQQFLQNVLGYSTRSTPGLAILPAAFCMVLSRRARPSWSRRAGRGSRC